MNMARFANVAVGTGVENWDGGDHYLGFSRGNKAFVAMGNLNREFYTGLPDGEYCDIIHDCQQKIQVRRMHGNRFNTNSSTTLTPGAVGDTELRIRAKFLWSVSP